jgi:hypothetical protein
MFTRRRAGKHLVEEGASKAKATSLISSQVQSTSVMRRSGGYEFECPLLADSVEKVGHGFHGNKVRA